MTKKRLSLAYKLLSRELTDISKQTKKKTFRVGII